MGDFVLTLREETLVVGPVLSSGKSMLGRVLSRMEGIG
jgi:hypothetical protein